MHLNTAKENAESFNELSKEVEVFPRKVASALRIKAEPQGFFESVWTGIEEYVLQSLRSCYEADMSLQVVHDALEGVLLIVVP